MVAVNLHTYRGRTQEARRRADAKRRKREPYRKLFDHIRQHIRYTPPHFSRRLVGILGYDATQFRAAIEAQLTEGMTWQAFVAGYIHIDHVKPLGSFDRTDLTDIRLAWSLDNIRPAWPEDNMAKLRGDMVLVKARRRGACVDAMSQPNVGTVEETPS